MDPTHFQSLYHVLQEAGCQNRSKYIIPRVGQWDSWIIQLNYDLRTDEQWGETSQ